MMHKLLFTEPALYGDVFSLERSFPIKCIIQDFNSDDELSIWLRNNPVDIIFTRIGLPITRKVIMSCPSIKIIATPTTGLDHVDINALSEYKVTLISLRDDLNFLKTITSTAEHAWAMLLAAARNLNYFTNIVNNGYWEREPGLIRQLSSSNLGIIGFGRLGQIIYDYGKAFRMNIRACDVNTNVFDCFPELTNTPLDELLESSDIIVLAASYYPGDPVILSSKEFAITKKGLILINISRGELIDESSLLHSLHSGHISHACLDVLSGDSRWSKTTCAQSPLVQALPNLKNLMITPHVGGYAHEAISRSRQHILDKVFNALELKQ